MEHKDKDYCNTKLKCEIFQRPYNELNEKQLIREMDLKQFKARIKSIKDVYRQELHKIEKSKKEKWKWNQRCLFTKAGLGNKENYLLVVLSTKNQKLNLASKNF